MSPNSCALAVAALVVALAVGGTVAPRTAVAAGDEREDIARLRAALERDFAAEAAACRDRFAVNACLEDVGRRRRQALEPLRDREWRLEERERRERTAVRERAAAARREGVASAASALPAPPPARARQRGVSPDPAPAPRRRSAA